MVNFWEEIFQDVVVVIKEFRVAQAFTIAVSFPYRIIYQASLAWLLI